MTIRLRSSAWRRTILPLLVVAGLALYQVWFEGDQSWRPAGEPGGADRIEQAYIERRSGVWVEVPGEIVRMLSDDHEGSRHQRFVLSLDNGMTVLIAHNIDLAPRVPANRGDEVTVRGRYEWNDRGGVVHWTHHDPERRIDGGWIDFRDNRYE